MWEWFSQINPNDILKSGVGAVIGFVLAQMVNVVKAVVDWRIQPRLVIEVPPYSSLEDWWAKTPDRLVSRTYGFYVRNIGKRVTMNIRCRLIRIEKLMPSGAFQLVSDESSGLTRWKPAEIKLVLPPDSKTGFEAAKFSDGKIFISHSGIQDGEVDGKSAYRFTVVAFDKQGRTAQASFLVDNSVPNKRDCRSPGL